MDTDGATPSPPGDDIPFATLFPPRAPGAPWRPTARTAALLHTALSLVADEIHDDVTTHGDRPVASGTESHWSALHRLPRSTWNATAAWRLEIADALDNLIEDLEQGALPFARTTAEHHGLLLALTDAAALLDEDPDLVAEYNVALPADPTDYDWSACRRHLLTTRDTGAADPADWFLPFPDVEPRA